MCDRCAGEAMKELTRLCLCTSSEQYPEEETTNLNKNFKFSYLSSELLSQSGKGYYSFIL